MSRWRVEDNRSRVQLGQIQVQRWIHEAAESVTESLEDDLQRVGYQVKTLSQELRTERDAVDRHETESRLLMINMRNLEGVASTVHDVVREYHVLAERETRAVSLWEKARHELLLAERAIETARTKPSASSRDYRADPGPGKAIISVEDDERRWSESALVADLTRMVEAWRGDRLRARAEADEGVATIQGAEARDKKLQYALDKARRSESMLRDRIRDWEAFQAAFNRHGTSYDDGRRRSAREEPADRDRETLARKLARAAADGRSAIGSTSSEVGDGNANARVREGSKLDFPKQLPTVTNLSEWKIKVALALVQASGYGGRRGMLVAPGMQ